MAIEELIRQRFELPAFSTLLRIARATRNTVNRRYQLRVCELLDVDARQRLLAILSRPASESRSLWDQVKREPKRFRMDAYRMIDLVCAANRQPARIAAGSVHHIAFRVLDDEQQMALRKKIVGLGCNVSPVMDRTYFHSIYFREPGGVLFEIATDPPGFTKDEAVDELGTHLCLPAWIEPARPQIEEILPKIVLPTVTTV
jgi:hypothetical protein